MAKCYIRNGVWAWPVPAQEKALNGVLDADALYRDKLTADRAKAPGRVHPSWLVERTAMLRPSGRTREEIHVATLLALAVNEADLVSVLAAATARNAAIVAHDAEITIEPGVNVDGIHEAVMAWLEARVRSRMEPGRLEGVRVAAERRRAATLKKARVATPLWRSRKPDRLSTDEVAARVELSVKTLYAELGRRPRIVWKGSANEPR